jgi:outer membrane receptor for ferrienterochelin and colicins
VSETPVSVSVITNKEIASSPAKTIEDLLIGQVGVQAARSVTIGEGIPSSINIRGIPGSYASSRTLVLVDGFPTNASGTPFMIVNEIPMEAIERIEIVRGPHSSLYGANAVGGVINILTKEGYGKTNGMITGETSYPFTVVDQYARKDASVSESLRKSGKMAYWNGNGTINGGNEKVTYLLSGGYRIIGNSLLADSGLVRQGDSLYRTRPDNYDYEEMRLFGKGQWYCSDNATITLHARYFNSDLGFGKTRSIEPESLDVNMKGNKILVGPQIKWSVSNNILLQARAFYRRVVGEFFSEGKDTATIDTRDTLIAVPTWWNSTTNDVQFESFAVFTLGGDNVLTAGIEILDNNANFAATINRITHTIMPNSFAAKKGILNSAGFLQGEFTVFKKLSLIPALRLDHHSEFGNALSPKLGLNYSLNNQITLRASSGRSFRAPSLAELYLPDFSVNPQLLLLANPNLKPEYLWGSDMGFEYSPGRSFTIKADVYHNSMKDLISQMVKEIDTTKNTVTHRNISDAWSMGVEAEATYRVLPWLGLTLNGTIQRSKDKTYDVSLDYIPEFTANFKTTVSYPFKRTRLDGEMAINHVGTRRYLYFTKAGIDETPDGRRLYVPVLTLDPHTSLDLSCKYSFSSHVWCAITMQNLLNAQWEEAVGTFVPRRFASIKTGISF